MTKSTVRFAEATAVILGAARVLHAAWGGLLKSFVGSIDVDFVARRIAVNHLVFTIGALSSSGRNRATTHRAPSGSGGFHGSYVPESCNGGPVFVSGSSPFGGNSVGKNAAGLILLTILLTGTQTVSGVYVFGRP